MYATGSTHKPSKNLREFVDIIFNIQYVQGLKIWICSIQDGYMYRQANVVRKIFIIFIDGNQCIIL